MTTQDLTPKRIEDRPIADLYGLNEALEDFLEAVTDPTFIAYMALAVDDSTAAHGTRLLQRDPAFRDGAEAAEEFFIMKDIIDTVVLPSQIFVGEEVMLCIHYRNTGNLNAYLLPLVDSLHSRVRALIEARQAA